MLCSVCGKELPDSAVCCTNCGAKLREENPPYAQQFNPVQSVQPELPMKWYKFLVNFSLFAGAVLCLISGILNLAGGYILGADAETLYSAYDGLRILDIGYGITDLAFVPFAIYVRFALSGFKKDAPKMYYIYSVSGTVITIFYTIFSSIIMAGSVPETIGQVIGNIIGEFVFITLNMTYFNKRKHLFVN